VVCVLLVLQEGDAPVLSAGTAVPTHECIDRAYQLTQITVRSPRSLHIAEATALQLKATAYSNTLYDT
jgi:hypothetical protein